MSGIKAARAAAGFFIQGAARRGFSVHSIRPINPYVESYAKRAFRIALRAQIEHRDFLKGRKACSNADDILKLAQANAAELKCHVSGLHHTVLERVFTRTESFLGVSKSTMHSHNARFTAQRLSTVNALCRETFKLDWDDGDSLYIRSIQLAGEAFDRAQYAKSLFQIGAERQLHGAVILMNMEESQDLLKLLRCAVQRLSHLNTKFRPEDLANLVSQISAYVHRPPVENDSDETQAIHSTYQRLVGQIELLSIRAESEGSPVLDIDETEIRFVR